jgi:hypothetical protein
MHMAVQLSRFFSKFSEHTLMFGSLEFRNLDSLDLRGLLSNFSIILLCVLSDSNT